MLALTALPTQAVAATATEIVITGSRLTRLNLETPTTTLTVGRETLDEFQATNFAAIAETLPQFNQAGSTRTASTFQTAPTAGLNNINLRGVGSNRNLVLYNGRRFPTGNADTLIVDQSSVPSIMVQRIEVITGGAAAVYGADAVSGVVNMITRDDFTGIEAFAQDGAALEHRDNINPQVGIILGTPFAESRGHVVMAAQYDYSGYVTCRERTICKNDQLWNPPAAPILDGGPTGGAVGGFGGALSGVIPGGRFFATGVAPATEWTRDLTTGLYRLTNLTTDGYNRNPKRTIAQPTSRTLFAASGSYDVTPWARAGMELNYSATKTSAVFEGNPFQSSGANNNIGRKTVALGGVDVTIPGNNPFIPAVILAANGGAAGPAMAWFKRFDENSLRGSDNIRQISRAMVSLEGDYSPLFDFGKDWTWNASYVFGRTTAQLTNGGVQDLVHLYQGLRVEGGLSGPDNVATPDREDLRCVDPVARALGCVPVNPFLPFTAKMNTWLRGDGAIRQTAELEQFLAYTTGTLFTLPGGPVSFLFGVEHRNNTGATDQSAGINGGTLSTNKSFDTGASSKTDEWFVEGRVPLLKDLFLVDSMAVEGAYRKTKVEGASEYETWKLGGDWQVTPDLRFRVMSATAVRAPSVGELSGGGQTFGVVNDPCRTTFITAGPNPAQRALNCAADGVPTPYAPVLLTQQGVGGFQVGNPDVGPERSESFTYGAVWSPDFIPGFAMSIDRWMIYMDETISLFGRQNIADQCYDLAPGARDFYCAFTQRGTATAEPVGAYHLIIVNDTNSNQGFLWARGVDIQAEYGFDLSELLRGEDMGRLSFTLNWALYDKSQTQSSPGAFINKAIDITNGAYSSAGTLFTSYSIGDLRFGWNMRYLPKIESFGDDGGTDGCGGAGFNPCFGARVYHNLRASWQATENYEFYMGIDNVFALQPPLMPNGSTGITPEIAPSTYDIFGRSAYAGVRVKY
jgi:outer membrane receptor protein involved in Fe transport